eukprot:TRINITY_DN38753_c0_g1_i1.p1 TRINITY_DN38753_c0_g1~~TRINITY_DN38753_c0_g1_i1.p1  ORF type:complete len:503 (+),score=36.56 TRINITY_DN38753_c0_g1_i1:107-1615(+)
MALGVHGLTEHDEVVRDLKKQLMTHASDSHIDGMMIRQLSDPQPLRSVETVSSIAQPGGFRRHHMASQGLLKDEHPSLFRRAISLSQHMLSPDMALPQLFDDELSSIVSHVRPSGNSSHMVTALVLIKSFLTGTLLVIPKGFHSAGLFGGCVVLLLVGSVEVYCMILLVRSRRAVGPSTYADLAGCLGRFGKPMLSVMLVVSQYGFVCAEQIYVADNALKSIQPVYPWLERWHLLFAFQLVLIPMSFVRKLKFYALTNLIGDAIIIWSVIYLFGVGFSTLNEHGPAPDLQTVGSREDCLLFFATCIYVYEGINMILPIYEAHLDKDRFEHNLILVLGSLTVVFISFGSVWYCMYGDNVADIASLNLEPGSFGALVVPPLYAIACLFTTPVLFFPIAQELEPRLFPLEDWRNAFSRKWVKNAFRASLMLGSAAVAAVGGKRLQNFLALIGGLCCGPLAIILPALIHWRICEPGTFGKIMDAALAVLGTYVTVMGTATAISGMN